VAFAVHALLGLSAASQTARNLQRSRECVLNLPSQGQVVLVDRLALTTGADAASGFFSEPSRAFAPPRVRARPVQLEAVVEAVHGIADAAAAQRGRLLNIDVRVARVHLEASILMSGLPNRVDPDKWRPLIMSLQKFYGLGTEQ
jgi:flavin reductase (DIM6/NTAB) family NADH-FMN oxidoreductase RutF